MSYAAETSARHYVLLDRYDPDRPVWRLLAETDSKYALVDEAGQVGVEEFTDAMMWASRMLLAVVSLRPLPSPQVYTVGEVDGRETTG